VYGPEGSKLEDKALVQVNLGEHTTQHSTAQHSIAQSHAIVQQDQDIQIQLPPCCKVSHTQSVCLLVIVLHVLLQHAGWP
jgi:hypothetical protein